MPTHAEYIALKEAGVCSHCGARPVSPGKTLCEQCRDTQLTEQHSPQGKERARRRSRTRYAKGKETRTCSQCHVRPAAPGKGICEECATKVRADWQRRTETRLVQGICVQCGRAPIVPGKRFCQDCIDYFHAAYNANRAKRQAEKAALKEKGICVKCKTNAVSGKHVVCDSCLSKQREHWRKKRFTSLQYQIMERDGFRCSLCNSDTGLVVHHLDGQGKTSTAHPNDDPANLITLCVRCHVCITFLRTLPISGREAAARMLLIVPS